jgi:hypothetical protein
MVLKSSETQKFMDKSNITTEVRYSRSWTLTWNKQKATTTKLQKIKDKYRFSGHKLVWRFQIVAHGRFHAHIRWSFHFPFAINDTFFCLTDILFVKWQRYIINNKRFVCKWTLMVETQSRRNDIIKNMMITVWYMYNLKWQNDHWQREFECLISWLPATLP